MFSWASKKKGDSSKGTDRKSQLEEFKNSFPAHRKPNNDDSIIEIVFSCQGSLAILRMYLTDEFPVQRPVFQVIGDYKHPWIDSFKRVTGAPMVNRWNIQNGSNLTQTVHEIINTLSEPLLSQCSTDVCHSEAHIHGQVSLNADSLNSADVIVPSNSHDSNDNNIDSNNNNNNANEAKTKSSTQQKINDVDDSMSKDREDITRMAVPPVPVCFPNLNDMSEVMLQRFLTDPHALEMHVNERVEIKELENMKSMLALQTAQQAEQNLKQIEALDSQRAVVLPDQYELKEAVTEYKKKYDEYMKKYSVGKQEIIDGLRRRKSQLEVNTNTMGEEFIKGTKSCNEFLKEYITTRKDFHQLAIKLKHVSGDSTLL